MKKITEDASRPVRESDRFDGDALLGLDSLGLRGVAQRHMPVADLGQNVAHEVDHAPLVSGVRQHRVDRGHQSRAPGADLRRLSNTEQARGWPYRKTTPRKRPQPLTKSGRNDEDDE